MNRTVCNSQELQAHALSLIPVEFLARSTDKFNVHALQKLIQWFRDMLTIEGDLQEEKTNLVSTRTQSVYAFVFLGRERRIVLLPQADVLCWMHQFL